MKTRSRMTGVALALALSMGGTLAACGGSDEASDSTESTPSASASEPSADAEPTADATTDAEPEADGEDGKPSRDDVVAGYTKVITGTAGANLPDDIVKQVVTCFVDELYEPASAQTLQAIADAEPTGVDPKDAQLFSDASTACTAKITG